MAIDVIREYYDDTNEDAYVMEYVVKENDKSQIIYSPAYTEYEEDD